MDLDITCGTRTSTAPDWARGFRQPEVPSLTRSLSLQTPFEDPELLGDTVTSMDEESDSLEGVTPNTPGAASSSFTGPVVTVEEVRANKRFKAAVSEEMSQEALWNLLAPTVMPDCRGE